MSITVSCPQGHRWEIPDSGSGLLVCPHCGGIADGKPQIASAQSGTEVNPSDKTATMPPVAHLTSSPPLPPGRYPGKIGAYEVLQVIGQGGMGVVYKALQPSLKRTVALKMLLQPGDDELALKRFHTEAEAVARLQHPNIIQIYEIGEHEGRPFLSLEYVEGGTLSQRLRRGLPMPREAAELAEQLARAVHFAHQRGIIHRDLKPSNILLSVRKEADAVAVTSGNWQLASIPKIGDFGLAKRTDSEAFGAVTQTGDILGTPSYMAPEQASGHIHEIGPATDVYALGAILYEMLTGQPPFTAPSALAALQQVLHDDPVAPRTLQPWVPRDLETICLTCLSKEPRQRYASADALANDLRAFLAGEPVQARRVTLPARLVRWTRRRPTAAVLLAVATLAAAGLFIGAWQYHALAVACLAVLSMLLAAWWYNHRLQNALRELAHQHHQAEYNVERLHFLLEATGRMMTAKHGDALLAILGETSTRLVNAERATIYVVDREKAELWSRVATGEGVGEIRIPLGTGISGMVGLTGETINLDDPYSDVRFNSEVDRRTGYRTRNLLTMPVKSASGTVIGVFQLLNKRQGNFDRGDVDLLGMLAAAAAGPLAAVGDNPHS
jgi:serine/threonine-protein kinase